MGIQCRIIRDNKGKVSYVEAPNGNRSKLYDDAVARVGEDSALDVVLTAYTPSFIEEVKNPKIADFRRQLVDRINSLPSTVGNISLKLNGIDQILNTNTLEMTTEDLGNGETLISFQAELETRYSMEGYTPVAPNGELSNLTVAQWQQVRTPEFMEWSNNWKDVIKDENGEPQVHYHGTPNHGFTEFNSQQGVEFFTPRKNIAETYAGFEVENPNSVYAVYIKSEKTLDTSVEIPTGLDAVIEENWKGIQNRLGYNTKTKKDTIAQIRKDLQSSEYNWEILEFKPVLTAIKDLGYTGMRTLEQKGNIGIFDNRAIKSATDNVGTFDGTNPDIRFSQGENVQTPEEVLEDLVDRLASSGLARETRIVSEQEIKQALEQSGNKFQQGINGFVLNDIVYINRERAGLDTPIHEFGHLWNSWMQQNAPEVFNRGIELIKSQGQEYIDIVNSTQPNLEGDAIYEEALAQAIGDSGAKLLSSTSKKSFADWLAEAWNTLKGALGLANTSLEEFQDLTLGEFSERAATDLLSGKSLDELMNSQAGSVGNAFRVNPNAPLTPSKTIERFEYDVDFTTSLPRKTLQEVVDEYEGRVFIVTSDATGVGHDSKGDPIYGGAGFMSIKDNVKGNVGFASLDESTVKRTLPKITGRFGNNQKVAVLVMVQNADATVGNYYGAKYFGRGLKLLKEQRPEEYTDIVNSIESFIDTRAGVRNEFKDKYRNGELVKKGTHDAFIELLRNVDQYNEVEFAKEFIKDTTFDARRTLLQGLLIDNADRRTDSSTPLVKVALKELGFTQLAYLQEYGDNTIFTEEMYRENAGGFVVGGFDFTTPENDEALQKLISETQKRGIEHPQFNGKLPSTGENFFLDGLYPVNTNFTEFAREQTIFNYDNISQEEIDKLVRETFTKDTAYQPMYRKGGRKAMPLSERGYTQLSVSNKVKLKELLAELDSNNLKTKPSNVAVDVARGAGFYPFTENQRRELASQTNFARFSISREQAESQTDLYLDRIKEVRNSNIEQYWSVDMPTREQVLDAALNDRLVDVNGGMGIVTEDGNMIGLFKYDTSAKGTAASVQQARIEKGGIKLDNFDGYLTELYKKNGFKVVSRLPFNEEIAPEGWNKEKHGTPDVVFMIYDPKGELDFEERTFDKTDYDGALAYRDSFIEEAKDIHPFYRQGLTTNKTGQTQGFFSDVVTGKSDKFKAKKEWTPILPFNTREQEFKSTYDKFKGNFDNHIATSIPTFRETQIKVGSAITEMFKNEKNPLVYDIGGSEGGFVKAITEESDGKIKSINLDLNSDMQDSHNRVPVEGSKFVLEAFYEGYTDEDTGITYKRHKPSRKADVVHESMVFQFIAPERGAFIKEVKKNYLKEDGIALFEEKLSTINDQIWLENERVKNTYKSQYYSQEELTQKQEEVLVGMKDNQTLREEFLEILREEFDYVEEYWDAGNFKGYLATNSESRKNEFLEKLGGRIQSQYSENKTKPKFSVGFMQTKTTPQGEQVMLSNVDDQVQGQGLGTEMYKQVASKLASQGTSLVSDFNNKGAEGIWGKLDEAGVTETVEIDGKRVNKIKMNPDSFDTNGEPNVSDVVQYIQSKNYEGVTLSEVERNEVSNVLLGTDMQDSEELYRALRRAFTPNGIYNPSEESLMASGLYTRVEARRLLDSEEAQLAAYEMMHKIKNSDNVENISEIDNSYITVTSSYNSIGTLRKANPFINQKTARELLGGIKDETLFSNQAEANDLEFANKKFDELSSLTRVSKIKVEGGRTSPHTNLDDLRTRMVETLTLPTKPNLVRNLNYILSVPNDVWNLEFNNVRTILEEIEGNAVDIGLDLSNLNEESYDKTPTEVKSLLSAVRNFAAIQNETTFEILLGEYVTFFDISESNNIATVELSDATASKSLVYSDTKSDAYTLFNNNGLLPLGNNLYQKVNTNKSLDEVYDIVYQTVRSGKKILPAQAFKNEYDVTDSKNEEFVRQDIVNYANEASKDIENSAEYDTDTLRKMVLFSAYFNTKLSNNRSIPSVTDEIGLITSYPRNAEYLRTEFISDFNKTMLREKVKNSEKYNNFYRHFDISAQGIELINTDPITMREIQPYLTDDLINHFRIKKEGINLRPENEGVIEGINEGILRNYYINYPKALPLYKGTYQMDNGALITDTNPNFIRVDEGLFEYVETVGRKSVFAKLEENNSDFKVYSTALRAPQLGEISKFNIAQGVKADKKINNLYTKRQDTDLTNEIDNC